MLDEAFLFGGGVVRGDVVLAHVVEQLPGHLIKSFLRQQRRVVLEVAEWNELHNVGIHVLFVLHGVEGFIVGVEDVHALEVFVADAHDDDGDGEAGAADNLVDSLLHVIDNTVCDDQQDKILLVVLRNLFV